MENLEELNKVELHKVHGGFHPWYIKYQIKATKYIYESLNGAYKEGYDLAIQSCK